MVVAMLCQACKIVEGQRYSKRLNDKQITSLLKFSCQRPQEQEAEILQVCIFNSWLYPCFLKQKPLKSKNLVLTAFILRGSSFRFLFTFPYHVQKLHLKLLWWNVCWNFPRVIKLSGHAKRWFWISLSVFACKLKMTSKVVIFLHSFIFLLKTLRTKTEVRIKGRKSVKDMPSL